jgi:flagellar motor switch protein FliM
VVDILSQAEIEALLATLSNDGGTGEVDVGGPAPASPAPASAPAADLRTGSHRSDKRTISYEPYDFRRPDKFAKDQLRTFQMLHETFARVFASTLSTYLRVSTHVDLISVEQIPYDEYMRSLTASIVTVFSMTPLSGQALLEMEFSVVLAMIDRLLGGPGNMVKNNTMLTEIEQALTESIITRALKDLKAAWEGIAHFTPRRERIETQAQFIQIVPPNDIVVSILFEVKVGDLRGAMSLCIPYLLLKPIASKLSAQRWFSTANNAGNRGKETPKLVRQIANTYVTCVCRLGSANICVQDLINLHVGDTIMLNRQHTDEVDLMMGDSVKFRGKPGVSGRKLAIHINHVVTEEIPRPPV